MRAIRYAAVLGRVALALGAFATAALAHEGHREAPRRSELGAFGRDLPRGAAHPSSDARPELVRGLGPLGWPGASADARAQAYFDQGLNLAWGFNHAEAVRAFRAAQSYDPGCVPCLWGEAWALGPNINMPMDAEANALALAAIERARRLAPRRGHLVMGLVEALARRHSADPQAERAALDRAYADAMRDLRARFPNEPEIAVLAADALMNLTPWDYWEDGGRRPKGATAEILALLEEVLGVTTPAAPFAEQVMPLRANPDHIGAIHLYIHMLEASDRPQRAAAFARRLGALAPANGHLVHMPAHVWYRLGEWRMSLEANRAAVAADRATLSRGGASRLYAEGYFPHNLHFVLASALMGGDGQAAVAAAEELAGLVSPRVAEEVPWTQPIAAAPYVAHARFAEPRAVLAMPRPDASAFVVGHWHYARGVALARLGDAAAARREAAAIRAIAEAEDVAALAEAGLPAAETLRIAASLVEGRAAGAAGDHAAAAALFGRAADAQEALPYMEPPFWFDPIRPAQGIALMRDGKVAEAVALFRAELAKLPANGWNAAGLLAAAQRLGDRSMEAEARALLDRSWFGPRLPAIERF
jgi:tetratricopeptide (TPR) repeat protein